MNYQQTVEYLFSQPPIFQRIGKAGFRVGLYVLPLLKDFRQRIKTSWAAISKQDVIDVAENHPLIFEKINTPFFRNNGCSDFQFLFERKDLYCSVMLIY